MRDILEMAGMTEERDFRLIFDSEKCKVLFYQEHTNLPWEFGTTIGLFGSVRAWVVPQVRNRAE